jgi:hypothetical protein
MSSSTSQPLQSLPTLPAQPFRLDVPLHNLLQRPAESPSPARVEHGSRTSLALPSPVFPQPPALLHDKLDQLGRRGARFGNANPHLRAR